MFARRDWKSVTFETEGRFKVCGRTRERYQIGPNWIDGWLARVQQLAPVVATDGTIEVNVFAIQDGK